MWWSIQLPFKSITHPKHVLEGLNCTFRLLVSLQMKSSTRCKCNVHSFIKTLPKSWNKSEISIWYNANRNTINLTTSFIYSLTNSSIEAATLIGRKCAVFVNLSTITQIVSLPTRALSNPTTKLLIICSHFQTGISNGFSSVTGL